MSRLPSRATWRTIWDKAATIITVLALAAAIGGVAWGLNNSRVARSLAAENVAQGQTIIAQNKTITRISLRSLNASNNHHASTVKADNAIMAAEAVISYEGGVITFLLGEIADGQQQGHQTLAELQNLQMEVTVELPEAVAALTKGQEQINAYLGYLTCINLNAPSICGTAPPLPPA